MKTANIKQFLFVVYLILTNFTSIQSYPELYQIIYANSLIPFDTELRSRVLTTICCNDGQYLPKVENAGRVQTQDGKEIQLMHNGIKIFKDCYYGAWMTMLIELLKGHHEPQEEKMFHEVLKYIPNNAVMVELGSYWGYYSMWFQHQIPGAKNYLVEPDPKNLVVGEEHFKLNKMKGHFTHAMVGASSMPTHKFIDWDYNEHNIPQMCIDNFAKEHDIAFIHILHADIQGAEVEMLKGCKDLIAQQRIGFFFISTHRGVHQDCLALLEEAGLDILVSITRDESFSADGLIVAKLPNIAGPENLEVSRRTSQFRYIIEKITHE